MIQKTISGHYGGNYSLAHNNREIISKNIDINRTQNNYNLVVAGAEAQYELMPPAQLNDFWHSYKLISEAYWQGRALARRIEKEELWNEIQRLRRLAWQWTHPQFSDPISEWIWLLTLPFRIPSGIWFLFEKCKAEEALAEIETELFVQHMYFIATRKSLRQSLLEHDYKNSASLLSRMDRVVRESSIVGKAYLESNALPIQNVRFATIEEVYSKLFEPSFRAFQAKQRPCRRYNGTYLEQIAERKQQSSKKGAVTKDKNRAMSEAIEIIFSIGDMDNTGYESALEDAQKSEALLHDFCDHLLAERNLCVVTTRELNDPNWKPPFKNGLLVLNLTLHADEATPGIHLTCIPYASGCKRGPEVQPAMGRALAGMGYPSTWKDELDEQGNKIPKTDRFGNTIYNKDKSVRYKQVPDGQGIVDWIEAQKRWIQKEMMRRYDWSREYKGSHPRDYLSIPDYKAARAQERFDEANRLFAHAVLNYEDRVDALTEILDASIGQTFESSKNRDLIDRYLRICSDEEYYELAKKAARYLDELSSREANKAKQDIDDIIRTASLQMQQENQSLQPANAINKERI